MPIEYLIKESLQSLKDNPLRSVLSILGVIFGVASVVAMLGIGIGAEKEVEKLLGSLGARNIHIVARDVSENDWQMAIRSTIGLSLRDARLAKRLYPESDVAIMASWDPEVDLGVVSDLSPKIIGVSSNFGRTVNLHLIAGRFFSAIEAEFGAPLAVISSQVAKVCCKNAREAINRQISIGDGRYVVIGVFEGTGTKSKTEEPAQGAPAAEKSAEDSDMQKVGMPLSEAIILPYESAVLRLGERPNLAPLNRVIVGLNGDVDPLLVAKLLKREILGMHRNDKVVAVIAAKEVIEKQRATSRLFTYFLMVIAFISIVVGAIGIANVMIASMIERVHEIGLRRAIGAKKQDIFIQFLTEALLVCIAGGAIGALFGVAVSFIIGLVMGWTISIPWWGMMLAFLISSLVGIASGIYPAIVAARISPIEALQGRRH
jgi:putative ABC transport system permease protein